LYAGEPVEGVHCVGAWQAGEVKDYRGLAVKPRLLTPLYGYHLPWQGNGGPFDGLVGAATQPPEVGAWLDEIGVESAVIVPVHVEGLPFELPLLHQIQVALHEAFHVEVQAPRWLGPDGDWPTWDFQPDRPALEACYAGDAAIEAALQEERGALDQLINALLDDDESGACEAGEAFLSRRNARYALLEGVSVADYAGTPGSCEAAEAIMELEEGTADFASWSRLYHMEQASRDDLVRRYQASQKDVFYLTGAMQLHAVFLMNPEGFNRITGEIAGSESAEQGSLTAVFTRELGSYCR
jgi:hypothetical protein